MSLNKVDRDNSGDHGWLIHCLQRQSVAWNLDGSRDDVFLLFGEVVS